MLEKEESMGFGMGLLIGGVVGLAIGVLYAPRPGKETRAMLMEKAEETKDKAEDILEEVKEKASKIIEEAKTKAAELRKKTGEAVSGQKQ